MDSRTGTSSHQSSGSGPMRKEELGVRGAQQSSGSAVRSSGAVVSVPKSLSSSPRLSGVVVPSDWWLGR